jgi:hypothetical protein
MQTPAAHTLSNSPLAPMLRVVEAARSRFHLLLADLAARGGLTLEQYRRYVVVRRYLTRTIRQEFLTVASHPRLADRRTLRDFLIRIAVEDEPEIDDRFGSLSARPCDDTECPLDVRLWSTCFQEVAPVRPFLALGAACVLQHLGTEPNHGAEGEALVGMTARGDRMRHALEAVPLMPAEIDDLAQGAADGAVMYLRMERWALGLDLDLLALQRAVGRGETMH